MVFQDTSKLCVLSLCLLFFGCRETAIDLSKDIYTGKAALERIRELSINGSLPHSCRNGFMFDGGSFDGRNVYWCFDCETNEECWEALECLTAVSRSEFRAFEPSRFAIVMKGPEYYSPKLRNVFWELDKVQNGWTYERARGNQHLAFYALDLDRHRVYGHLASGGFPTEATRLSSDER